MPRFSSWLIQKEYELKSVGMSCANIRQYPSFICFANPERGVPPHLDGTSSVLTALTVLGYANDEPAPVTNFFRPISNNLQQISHYRPSNNSLLVWLNLANSLHGVVEHIKPGRLTHTVSLESYEIERT